MVTSKAKFGLRLNRATDVNSCRKSVGGVQNLKIYSEIEKIKDDASCSKPTTIKKESTVGCASRQKSGLKCMEKCKDKNGDSGSRNIGRKALADVSNMQAKSSMKILHDASKPARTAKISLIPARPRMSLPVLKKANQSSATNPKEISEKVKERADPVSCRVGKKPVPQAVNSRSHLGRNRTSDGFIMTGQAKVDARALSRKSVKRIVKTTVKAFDCKRTLRSKFASGIIKPVTASVSSSRNDEEVASSLPDSVAHEPDRQEVPSDRNQNPSTNTIIKFRRRSYTSTLMAGSKLLEEKLPSIDDQLNQLEVAEYVDDIYQYYWVTESQTPPLADYMSKQTHISPQMRGILINWLIEVHLKFDLMHETLYLTVALFDWYVSQVIVKKDEMQLVGLTALLLASKYEDFWHPRVEDLISISAKPYTRDQMLEMEVMILKKLKFRLNIPTLYVFMLRFLKAAQSNTKLEHLSFYLIELCLVEYEALRFRPSLICASAIYVARCTLQMTPCWSPLLGKHTRYEVSHMRECAEMILKFQKYGAGQLRVAYDKYIEADFLGVAAVKPVDRLPL